MTTQQRIAHAARHGLILVCALITALAFTTRASAQSANTSSASTDALLSPTAPRSPHSPGAQPQVFRIPHLLRPPEATRGELGMELFSALATSALSLSAGFAVGALSAAACESSAADDDQTAGYDCAMNAGGIAVLVAYTGMLLATPGAVTSSGRNSGGTGNYGWAVLGSGIGLLGASLAMPAMGAALEDQGVSSMGTILPMAGIIALASSVGAVIGYRMSAEAPLQAGIAPSPDGRGGVVSLSGAF